MPLISPMSRSSACGPTVTIWLIVALGCIVCANASGIVVVAEVIVDTDILIDVIRSIPEAITYVQSLERGGIVGISSITYMELLIGCRNKTEQRKVERFVGRYQLAKLNEAITDRAITLLQQYRLSHGLLIADGLIAATALVIDKPLASKNQRDYRFIAGLTLLPYP
jgi:predicted nucleic acid-binding protein